MLLDDLIRAAKEGEDWAGPALVTLLLPMLMDYVKGIADDLTPAEQEQVVEVAVLRSVARIGRYDRERAQFPTWVRGYLRFAVSDCRRSKRGMSEELVAEMPAWLEQPSGEALGSEEAEGLTWSLLQLPLTDQVIIALRDFEGLKYAECAVRIGGGVTEEACRVRHHRALKRLKAILDSDPAYCHLAGESNDG